MARIRRSGRRSRGGRLVYPREDLRNVALAQPHRKGLARDERLDQRAEHSLGQLSLRGEISKIQYDAGQQYDRVTKRYRVVILSPPSTPSVLGALVSGTGGHGGELSDEEAQSRTESYNRAYEALNRAGGLVPQIVARVAVWGEACATEALRDLRCGLDLLAEHFGLTPRKNGNIRNLDSEKSRPLPRGRDRDSIKDPAAYERRAIFPTQLLTSFGVS